jgi:hypothetical protein
VRLSRVRQRNTTSSSERWVERVGTLVLEKDTPDEKLNQAEPFAHSSDSPAEQKMLSYTL